MSDSEDLKQQIVDAAAKPAGSTIEGNTINERPIGDLIEAQKFIAQQEVGRKKSKGVVRQRFRHQGPSGGQG